MARQCLMSTIRHQTRGESSAFATQSLQQSRVLVLFTDVVVEGAKCEELEKVIIGDDDEMFFQVGVQLPPWEKEKLIVFLRENIDVFALNAYKAPGWIKISFIII